jgi:GNAT superfamily N-acetyltransferase
MILDPDLENHELLCRVFKKHSAIFPHIRQDYIFNMLKAGKCWYENGVIIMFNQYKRNNKIGNITAPKGSFTIKQIVNENIGSGSAAAVLEHFIEFAKEDVYLSVRKDNTRAVNFYKKNLFHEVGAIAWKGNTIPGLVFIRKNQNADRI